MNHHWLREIEQIAQARWAATEPGARRRAPRTTAVVRQAEEIAGRRWAVTAPPARDLQSQLAADHWWATPAPGPIYRLFDAAGQPIRCHLCGRHDHWMPEGDGERQVVRMFVCEHEPLRIGHGLVRQVSTVALGRVARCEGTPSEE
jgi:hypothetical protein